MIKEYDINTKFEYVDREIKYLNKNTFEIVNTKSYENYEVDKLIVDTISILNKKGYTVKTSKAAHYLSYYVILDKEQIIDEIEFGKYYALNYDGEGKLYYYMIRHGMYPLKCEYVNKENDNYLEVKEAYIVRALKNHGIISENDIEKGFLYKVIEPTSFFRIKFKDDMTFEDLPNEFNYSNKELYKEIDLLDDKKVKHLLKQSISDIRKDIKEIDELIQTSSNDLLKWAKSLPYIETTD